MSSQRPCRVFIRELSKVYGEVTIQGPVYQAISAITGKTAELAELLTGEQGYFSRGLYEQLRTAGSACPLGRDRTRR